MALGGARFSVEMSLASWQGQSVLLRTGAVKVFIARTGKPVEGLWNFPIVLKFPLDLTET